MKINSFSEGIQKFMTEHLPGVCGCSGTTVDSYRYAYIHFLDFMLARKKKRADKVKMTDFNYKNVQEYLEWLETDLNNGVSTRNQRLAAMKSLARFLMYEYPDYLSEYTLILGIKQKKSKKAVISYAKVDGTRAFLEEINRETPLGRRDYTLFSLMFTTGIRVSEAINIKVKDISLSEPSNIRIHGKGNKTRLVPIMKQVLPILENYMKEHRFDRNENLEEYLFQSKGHRQLTRQALNYQVTKYTEMANKRNPGIIPEDFSPHKIRHSTAMTLLASDVDLIYIRDLLGHSTVTTTEVYARTESARRREVLEAASTHIVEREAAEWEDNPDLKQWLKRFGQ